MTFAASEQDPRDAIRTLADAYGLAMADAARLHAGEINYTPGHGLHEGL